MEAAAPTIHMLRLLAVALLATAAVTTAGAGKPCLDVPLRQKLTDLDPDPCVGHRCDTDPCP